MPEVNLVDSRSTSAKTQHPHLGIKFTRFISLGVVDFSKCFPCFFCQGLLMQLVSCMSFMSFSVILIAQRGPRKTQTTLTGIQAPTAEDSASTECSCWSCCSGNFVNFDQYLMVCLSWRRSIQLLFSSTLSFVSLDLNLCFSYIYI